MTSELQASEHALDLIQAAQAKKQEAGIKMTLEDGSQVIIDDILNT